MQKTKIIIVDDHDIFRDGLVSLFSKINKTEVLAQAKNGKEFIELLDDHDPDLVLMDISMPVMNGIEATKLAIEKYPDLKILVLSMFGDEEYYFRMVHAGAKGFVLKTTGIDELLKAIEEVSSGDNFFSNELLRKIILSLSDDTKKKETAENISDQLTDRELEVLRYICSGRSGHEIADAMNLSPKTIEGYRSKILAKTNCKNSINLVMYAISNELITIDK